MLAEEDAPMANAKNHSPENNESIFSKKQTAQNSGSSAKKVVLCNRKANNIEHRAEVCSQKIMPYSIPSVLDLVKAPEKGPG